MHNQLPLRAGRVPALLFAACSFLSAGQTKDWVQAEYADFEKGISKSLSLRSDGLLTLAPRSQEIYDTSSGYLWALAQDSKGNLYAGGGPGAKLFRLSPTGDKKVIAEMEGLEIHALAVDRDDRVYAATSPDGKVYRVDSGGKAQMFYDPKAKYIWAMAFDSKGNLFVATGDKGEIHKVGRDGKGAVFFKTDETHARSMVIDPADNLVVGTDPGGLVFRVSPAGQGFVLYQLSKKEVTSVVLGREGEIYAAAVGNKQSSAPSSPPAPALPPAPAGIQVSAGTQPGVRSSSSTSPPSLAGSSVSVAGGSEVYRIDRSGDPRKVWSHPSDIVYAMTVDATGRVLLGTGNKGYIYRLESPVLYTALLNGTSTQVTVFQSGRSGRLFVGTGNVGKIYEIGPGLEKQGTIESEVFDAGVFSQWGRLSYDVQPGGGTISVVARTGNLDQPQKNWSPWSAPVSDPKGARPGVPAARFAQWKATLTAAADGKSPQLAAVYFAYLPRNVEPRIEQVEITPANYKFPAPALAITPANTLSLPPLGRRTRTTSAISVSTDSTSTPAMQYAKGFMGVRWVAADENGDTLIYNVDIRGVDETEWKPLKSGVKEKYFSFDSTAFPDGDYKLRITASDAPSNPPAEALTAVEESEVFQVDNTPPQITGLAAARSAGKLDVRWRASDALSNIKKSEYSLDGGEWTVAPPVGGLSDSPTLDYQLSLDAPGGSEHTVAVRVEDEYDNKATDKAVVKR